MKEYKVPIQSLIDHIKTACDVDPWAKEMAEELLKEQEVKIPGGDSGMCEICSFYKRSLPVKPHYNARTNWYECGSCHHTMTSGMHYRNELIPAYKVNFCARCGKGVKWDA